MKKYICISLGAMVGASLRFAISMAAASLMIPFFIGTFAVNMVGAFAAGTLFAMLHGQKGHVRDFLITGLLGSFTTFSLLTYEQYVLLSNGEYFTFILYGALNMFGGLCFVLMGWKAGGSRI
ncbi:fluoride efflux transporter FluC [Salinicoccus hispanicus]|uniref:Fluoride-specific ion channel FluC n=1 Tax=Salinicoccus hispanicus TaxID=157225 RepID=A0A6N8TX83_9STAP|nr:CrcB family protein [Salinicoccus hispanicus]MXQ50534.1 CrcB family protein [Salinicoccus hispanicus]